MIQLSALCFTRRSAFRAAAVFVVPIFLASCGLVLGTDGRSTGVYGDLSDLYSDTVPPELEVSGGGLLENPAPSGSVRYLNILGSASESDIVLDAAIAGHQAAGRYLYVSGTAEPDDSGNAAREYHSVLFRIRKTVVNSDETYAWTFPVDGNDRFGGFLYFPTRGTWSVSAVRYPDEYLYPRDRGSFYSVPEGSSTLAFTVETYDDIPAGLRYLLPTQDVNSGNTFLRRYAESITSGQETELGKAEAIFEFLVSGDENGTFTYTYYEDLSPGYLDGEYADVLIASEFLDRRWGVCNDFAELYAALARAVGLDVCRVTGFKVDSNGNRTGHQWNIVRAGGTEYRLDATWANGAAAALRNPFAGRPYAEFYPEFDPARFEREHDRTFSASFSKSR